MGETSPKIIDSAQRFIAVSNRADEEFSRMDFARSLHAGFRAGREFDGGTIASSEVIGSAVRLGKEAVRFASVMTVLIPRLAYRKLRLGAMVNDIDVSPERAKALIEQNQQ